MKQKLGRIQSFGIITPIQFGNDVSGSFQTRNQQIELRISYVTTQKGKLCEQKEKKRIKKKEERRKKKEKIEEKKKSCHRNPKEFVKHTMKLRVDSIRKIALSRKNLNGSRFSFKRCEDVSDEDEMTISESSSHHPLAG